MQNVKQVSIATKDVAYAIGLTQLLNSHFKVVVQHLRSEEEVLQQRSHLHYLIIDASSVLQFLDLAALSQECRVLALQDTEKRTMVSPSLCYLPKAIKKSTMVVALAHLFGYHNFTGLPLPISHLDLSPSEQQILEQLCSGYNLKEIAALLELSPKTSKAYRQSLFAKFEAKSTAHLVYRCFKTLPQGPK